MLQYMFTPKLSERKRILKEVCKRHPQWKRRSGTVIVLFVLSVLIMVADCVMLILHPTTPMGVYTFIAGGLCFACVPYFFALSVKNTAKYKCGFPYTCYANASLVLKDDELEYIFWRVGSREPAAYSCKHAVYRDEDKFVYSIQKKDILSLTVDNETCYIKGNGKVEFPEWADEDEYLQKSNNEFSFILAFEQENISQSINLWMQYK